MYQNARNLSDHGKVAMPPVFKPDRSYAREVTYHELEDIQSCCVKFRHVESGDILTVFHENGIWVLHEEEFFILAQSRETDDIHKYLAAIRTE